MPPKITGRDMGTYDQRRELFTAAGQDVEKAIEVLGGDPTKRIAAEGTVHRNDSGGSTAKTG
jgi:hypothetical protein